MVEGKFQVYQDIAKKYRFRLRASNNKIVTVGEAYESKEGCLKGVNAVKKYCHSPVEDLSKGEEKTPAPKFQIFKDRNEKYRFHLMAPNHEIVAVSEGYESKDGCLNGIDSVKNNCEADIEDLTPSAQKAIPHVIAVENVDKVNVEEGDVIVVRLDEPPKTAEKGSNVIFTGKLLKGSAGLGGKKINLYESDRSFMQDDYLASGVTDADGSFSITWVAKNMDWWDDTVEAYARYMDVARRLIHYSSKRYRVKIV